MGLLTIKSLQTEGMRQPISWTIQAHELWLLYGVSGTGKSQLLKAVADLIESSGEVCLSSRAKSEFPAPVWRRQVMYFSAETAWWCETIADHFMTLPSDEVLAQVGLERSILNEHPDLLSSGQKQRLALLRGLSFAPTILLLDEVSANLDPESVKMVEALIQEYVASGENATIWISHDLKQRERLACPAFCRDIEDLY